MRLADSARFKAADMVERGYYEHKDPISGRLNGVEQAYLNTGKDCKYISENLLDAAQTHSPTEDIAAWMASAAHRDAILNPIYDTTGISIVDDKIVQQFCDLAE